MDPLSQLEKELSRHSCYVEFQGKHGITIPVLVNKETKGWLDVLVSRRYSAGFPKDNNYVLARVHYGPQEYVRGSEGLRATIDLCDAKEPLRYLGHDIRVHLKYYHIPDQTFQEANISTVLLAMERGVV